MWNYTYSTIRDATHSCMGVGKVETKTGYKMELDILFQGGVVLNFTYAKVPIQSLGPNNRYGRNYSTTSTTSFFIGRGPD